MKGNIERLYSLRNYKRDKPWEKDYKEDVDEFLKMLHKHELEVKEKEKYIEDFENCILQKIDFMTRGHIEQYLEYIRIGNRCGPCIKTGIQAWRLQQISFSDYYEATYKKNLHLAAIKRLARRKVVLTPEEINFLCKSPEKIWKQIYLRLGDDSFLCSIDDHILLFKSREFKKGDLISKKTIMLKILSILVNEDEIKHYNRRI